jgi:predicted transcriptional regulator
MADGLLRAWRGTKANDGGRSQMRVSEAMTREVRMCKPQHSIRECAKAMADMDVGVLPVAENNLIVGMVTDRISRCVPLRRARDPIRLCAMS